MTIENCKTLAIVILSLLCLMLFVELDLAKKELAICEFVCGKDWGCGPAKEKLPPDTAESVTVNVEMNNLAGK